LYFDGSVKGLSIGAPVMFRGVSIGSVKDISLIYDSKAGTIMLPVIVEN
jgi:paraquat-inducible protein B